MEHKFPFKWFFEGTKFTKDKGKVFSCFACGGGSTMGYKLAGFDVIGCNEIDPRMNKVYVANHHPKFNFLEPIQDFKLRKDLPSELYNLDILDGSPPCSSFSIAGNRDTDWGKKKKFREGQATQVLDTLFFDFIDLAKKLQPKIVIAENVKGLIQGEAWRYVREIYDAFDDAGYMVCHNLCDASLMGVPQRRERVFFTSIRKDLFDLIPQRHDLFYRYPYIDLVFKEKQITCRECNFEMGDEIKGCYREDYDRLQRGEPNKYLQSELIDIDVVHPTITAGYRDKASPMPKWSPQWLSPLDLCKVSTFPQDYDFGREKVQYICGMSVPPVMMANVALRVYEQWLSKINKIKTCSKDKKEPIQLTLF